MPLDQSREERERYLELLREQDRRRQQRRYYELYPDETVYGPDGEVASVTGDPRTKLYARRLYPNHLAFFEATARYREVGVVAGNRTGKTVMGAFATAAFLTGIYPEWWPGRRFERPTRVWASGKTYETVRGIVQAELLGTVMGSGPSKRMSGTGMIPGALIDRPKWKQGSVSDVVDVVRVRHVSGGWSTLGLKAYEQGRGTFEGTAQDAIWLDEEPPMEVWMECVTRTATTNGILYGTFTPLEGLSETAMLFYPTEV